MKDEKEPLEQKQNSEEEEYSFLQEIIKDEAGDQAKWKHDVLRRIQLGLIFGLVACFTFFACKPWLEKRIEQNPTEVTIPQDEQQEKDQQQGNGHDQAQTLRGALLVLELTTPGDLIATGQGHGLGQLCLGLVHEAHQVAATHIGLNDHIALGLLPIDLDGAIAVVQAGH